MDNYAFHSGTGRIVYDPRRGSMKSRTAWWCVINVDREITRYYRWLIEREFWGRTAIRPEWLCQPSWDAHISVVRGERPRAQYRDLWGKYQGEVVEFEYAHYPRQTTLEDRERRHAKDGDFWFVTVVCPRIDEIRGELGLRTQFRYHLTVGRTYDARD